MNEVFLVVQYAASFVRTVRKFKRIKSQIFAVKWRKFWNFTSEEYYIFGFLFNTEIS